MSPASKRRRRFRDPRRLVPLLVLALALVSCQGAGEGNSDKASSYVEQGDLDALRAHGRIRILLPSQQATMLPRAGNALDLDLKLAEELAVHLGLEAEFRVLEDRRELIAGLIDGRGDLAIARMTATAERREQISFSLPIDHVREMLVTHVDAPPIAGPEDLAGVRVSVRESSSFFGTLTAFRAEQPELEIDTVDEHLDTEELLYRVARGELQATVADEDLVEQVRNYLPELQPALALTQARPIAWGMRPDAEQLKAAVDGFLQQWELTRHLDTVMKGDLDAIKERRVLRVLTRNNGATYFLHKGRQVGFEFELARRFARQLGCRVQVVVPPTADLLIPWLLEGRGDLIAASLTVTPERSEQVAFGRRYNEVEEMLVAHVDDPIETLDQLSGRTISVRPSSAYHQSLSRLQNELGFVIGEAAEHLETEELIEQVATRSIELTVADSNILAIEQTYREDVRAVYTLGDPRDIAWAVRPEDTGLLAEVDRFWRQEYRGEFYNILRKRYFANTGRIARLQQARVDGALSPYDDLFRKWADEIEVDWRLLAAQAFVESEFDPGSESWAGAVGLMQVLPQTAEQVGVEGDLRDPEIGIRAGALYMDFLIDRFDPSLPLADRLRFALAAYNAGLGHVLDGRRLARAQGLDPDLWFGNVAQVLPLLSRQDYANQARYGYCRCRETLAYVRQIDDAYAAYIRETDIAGAEPAGSPRSPSSSRVADAR